MSNNQEWMAFVQRCAAAIVAGNLTTCELRTALRDPIVRTMAARENFRIAVISACENVRPNSTRDEALMQEIDAADKRIRQLIAPAEISATRSSPVSNRRGVTGVAS